MNSISVRKNGGVRGNSIFRLFNLGKQLIYSILMREKILLKSFVLLIVGIFILHQIAFARFYTESHMLDDYFRDNGPEAAIYGVTSIASIFLPSAAVSLGIASPAAATTGVYISTVVNVGTQIAVAAGADPQTCQVVGGVVGGLASGIYNVVNSPISLTTAQGFGIVAVHTAAWSAQPVISNLLSDHINPSLAGLVAMAGGMAVQVAGAKIYNSLSSTTSLNPSDLSMAEGKITGTNYLQSLAKSLPGIVLSSGLSYAVSEILGDDAQEPWGASLINAASGLGMFLGNYAAHNWIFRENNRNPSQAEQQQGERDGVVLVKKMQTNRFWPELMQQMLFLSGRFGVQTGFGYANKAVAEELQGNSWALPIMLGLNTAEGMLSLLAGSGLRTLYQSATNDPFFVRDPTFKDILRHSAAEAVGFIYPIYDPSRYSGATPEEKQAGALYRYQDYVRDTLALNTNISAQIPEQLKEALAGMDENSRDIILAIYLNRGQVMPTTGYNALRFAQQFSYFGAIDLGQVLGGQANNLIVGSKSPYYIYDGIIADQRIEKRYEDGTPKEMIYSPRYQEIRKGQLENRIIRYGLIEEELKRVRTQEELLARRDEIISAMEKNLNKFKQDLNDISDRLGRKELSESERASLLLWKENLEQAIKKQNEEKEKLLSLQPIPKEKAQRLVDDYLAINKSEQVKERLENLPVNKEVKISIPDYLISSPEIKSQPASLPVGEANR